MVIFLIQAIHLISRVLTFVVIVDILLSYFLSPWNTVRQTLDRIVSPMLAPIRRVVPPVGMLDLSPLVLVILIQVIEYVLVSIIYMVL